MQGKDIVDGNKKLTLALIWQLMRHHLLGTLQALSARAGPPSPGGKSVGGPPSPGKGGGGDGGRKGGGGGRISDAEMILWANERVAKLGFESSMRDFHDK